MQELELNNSDKNRLKDQIKGSLLVGFLLLMVYIGIAGIMSVIYLLGVHMANGFGGRILRGIIYFVLLISIGTLDNIFKYFDLRGGKKLQFKSNDYEIRKMSFFPSILLKDNAGRKVRVLNRSILNMINEKEPIVIDISKVSKTLLFISNNTENLLDKPI